MEVHSMLPFFELQCLTGLSCWLNGIFLFKTIFPVFPIVWLYKGKIVSRKVQSKINEQDMQERLVLVKLRLPQSSWDIISIKLKGGKIPDIKKAWFSPFAPVPHLSLCLSLDFGLHCLEAWEFASYQWKWPHLVIKCYSDP